MKKNILKALVALSIVAGATGCGNGFLDTKYYSGIDVDTGLSGVDNIKTALNGTYYRFFTYRFTGGYALDIADIPTDMSYWNAKYGHFDTIYRYIYTDTDSYLLGIWNYGYKVVDNAARVIQGVSEIYDDCSAADRADLDLYAAEAYALRAYADLILVNVYGHQVKVDGTDFSSRPGIVLVDEPVEAYTSVSRSTVGETYDFILSDLQNSLTRFEAAGGDRGDLYYIGKAATYGLLARTNLYLENWSEAASYARKALDEGKVTSLTYDADAYKALYNDASSNSESFFALAITTTENGGSESVGNYWSVYGFSPSVKAQELFSDTDCRRSVFTWDESTTDAVPVFSGGKFAFFSSDTPDYATSYLVNAPEQYLIIAESKWHLDDLDAAREALLTVAKRDSAISSVSDLPSASDEFYAFFKDERARELFQEGFRLWDLRRWCEAAEVYAYGAPENLFTYTNYNISDLVFPIPSDEVTSGFGVEQNEGWSATKPQ